MTLALCLPLYALGIQCEFESNRPAISLDDFPAEACDFPVSSLYTMEIADGRLACDSDSEGLTAEAAAALLREANIPFAVAQTCALVTCDACDCESGTVFRFVIPNTCLDEVTGLGFRSPREEGICEPWGEGNESAAPTG